MNSSNYSFPHPVLGNGDDIGGLFEINMQLKRVKERRTIEFQITEIRLENFYFQKQLFSKHFGLLYKVYCGATFMTWTFINPDNKFEINEEFVFGKVDVECYIISLNQISDYQDKTFHPDFESYKFAVEKYDIVGMVGKITVPIDHQYEKRGISNIFLFVPESEHNSPISYEFNGDKIIIKYPLSETGSHIHHELFGRSPWVAYNIFITPALTEAFRIIMDEEKHDDFKEKEWFQVLDDLLPIEIRSDDPYINAQLLIASDIPVFRAYKEVCES